MEIIDFNDIIFTKAGVVTEVVDPHHKAYTRVQRGKMQMIPQKGAVIKERGEIHKELVGAGAKGILGKDYERFAKDLNSYFHVDREIYEMKSILEGHLEERESYMARMGPLLSKFENLSDEENKFKTEFLAEGFKHKFQSYPRATEPYKELFEESFKRLTEKYQAEMSAMRETLKKITVQERFERVEKAVNKADPYSKMEDHFRNIVRIKEEMLKLMKKVDANMAGLKKATKQLGLRDTEGGETKLGVTAKEVIPKKRVSKSEELPKVIILEKARTRGAKDIKKRKIRSFSNLLPNEKQDVASTLARKLIRANTQEERDRLVDEVNKYYPGFLVKARTRGAKDIQKRKGRAGFGDVAYAKYQLAIAKKTLSMPPAMAGVMGGMTVEEAKEFMRKHNMGKSETSKHLSNYFVNIDKAVKENGRTKSKKKPTANHDMSERRKLAEPIEKVYLTTLDEEIEKAQVKAHVRTRGGRMERVKQHWRKMMAAIDRMVKHPTGKKPGEAGFLTQTAAESKHMSEDRRFQRMQAAIEQHEKARKEKSGKRKSKGRLAHRFEGIPQWSMRTSEFV